MLHGKIEINHLAVCEYKITNEGKSVVYDTPLYRAVVSGRDHKGYSYNHEWEFSAKASAPRLVAMVLEELDRILQ